MRRVFVLGAVAMGLLASSSHAQKSGAWVYTEHTDAMTDEDRSAIAAFDRNDLYILWVRCMEDGLNIMAYTKYMGGDEDDEVLVQVRFDSAEALPPTYWGLSTNRQAAFAPRGDVAGLIAQMKRAATIRLRVTDPLDGERVDMDVSLVGFTQSLRRLPCAR